MTTDCSAWKRTRDGRELYLERRGTGTPIVVFEAGMGASGNCWGAIAPRVSERTTAVVYDRSGLGRSPSDSAPRNLSRLADDLSDVLEHLGAGPFVLVGHSWGGPIVRSVAARVPERIAGLVLVDQTDEGCDLFFSKANERQTRLMKPLVTLLARTGVLRIAVKRLAANLPEPSATAMRRYDGTPAAVRAQLAELEASIVDLAALRAHPPVVPAVPLVVISGGRTGRFERGRRRELVEAHRARAEAHPQGRHVIAERSSHYVPFTDPDVVVAEIERILGAR